MDHTIRIWDLVAGRELRRIAVEFTDKGNAPPIAFEGRRVLSTLVGEETAVKMWNADNGEQIRSFIGHTDEVWGLAISPDGRRALSGGRDRTLRLWDTQTGRELHCFTVEVGGSTPMIKSIIFSADGRKAVIGINDRSFRLYRLPE